MHNSNIEQNGVEGVEIALQTFYKFKEELAFKENQINILRKRLDDKTHENFELVRRLEKSCHECNELQVNLKVCSSKCNELESKLREQASNLMGASLKQNLLTNENETLRNLSEKLSLDKYELEKRIEEMQHTTRNQSIRIKDFNGREAKLRSAIKDITEMFQKLQADQQTLLNDCKVVEELRVIVKENRFETQQYLRLEEKFDEHVQELVKSRAKANMMEQLLSVNPEMHAFLAEYPSEGVLWEKAFKVYKEQIMTLNDIVKELKNKIQDKEESICRLIQQYEYNINQIKHDIND